MKNNGLDQLFSLARNQAPEVSFEETKRSFLAASVLAVGGVLATKSVLQLFTKKGWIMMMSSITVISVSTVVGLIAFSPDLENNLGGGEENNIVPTIEIIEERNELSPEDEMETTFNFVSENNEDEFISNIEMDGEQLFSWNTDEIYPENEWDDTIHTDESDSKEKIRPYSERFVITTITTIEELDQIQENAEKAGIEFTYTAKVKQGRLKQLKIKARIEERNNKQSISIATTAFDEEESPLIIGWYTNKKGIAQEIGIGEPENNNCDCYSTSDMKNFNDQMDLFNVKMDYFDMALEENIEKMLFGIEANLTHLEINLENLGGDRSRDKDEFEELLFEFNLEKFDLDLGKIDIEMEKFDLKMEQFEQELELFHDEMYDNQLSNNVDVKGLDNLLKDLDFSKQEFLELLKIEIDVINSEIKKVSEEMIIIENEEIKEIKEEKE